MADARRPPWWLAAGHLGALWSIAVALPVFDLLSDNTTFFVAHGTGPLGIVLVAVVVVLAVPALAAGAVAGVRVVSEHAADVLLASLIGVLAALVAAPLAESLLPDAAALVVAGVVGVAAGISYAQGTVVRAGLSVLVPVPLVLVAWFLLLTPTRTLVFPPSVSAAGVPLDDDPPPVFVVVFDELPVSSLLDRDLTVDADRYPNLARLAGDGTLYPNTTTVAAYTHEAIPAILTGRAVAEPDVPPIAGAHPDNLFALLAGSYEITALEQLTELCADELCEEPPGGAREVPVDVLATDLAVVGGHASLPAGLAGLLPDISDSWSYFGRTDPGRESLSEAELSAEAERLGESRRTFVSGLAELDRLGQWQAEVARIERRDVPVLHFLHTPFPHIPWTHHPDGRSYADLDNPGLEDNHWTSAYATEVAMQRHLLQAGYADTLLGELLDRLDELGLYDEALVVATSDHGVAFEVGDHRRRISEENLDGIAAVPLVVKLPGQRAHGQVDDRPVEKTDILPTVADVVGAALPWDVDGRSLLDDPPGEDRRRVVYDHGTELSTDGEPLEGVAATVERIYERFGASQGGLSLYGIGPHRDLVGTSPGEMALTGPAEGCWSPGALPDADDPGLTGWLDGSLVGRADADPVAYAVAVDGVIAATSYSYDDGERPHRTYAVADPDAWGGPGEVALYEVGGGAEPALAPIDRCR